MAKRLQSTTMTMVSRFLKYAETNGDEFYDYNNALNVICGEKLCAWGREHCLSFVLGLKCRMKEWEVENNFENIRFTFEFQDSANYLFCHKMIPT